MALKMDDEELPWFNKTNDTRTSFSEPVFLSLIVSLSVIYGVIFVTGILGNIMTCIVIGRNRSMHTDTNLYLVNLAISDLLLLICGMPLEIYRLWKPFSYSLLESLCTTLGLISETSANGTILTTTAFTLERYTAICCPSLHKTSNLSRAMRYIIVIWACALCSAVLQAMVFGIIYEDNGQIVIECTVMEHGVHQPFTVSSFSFFIVWVPLITVLYVLIGVKLHTSRVLHPVEKSSVQSGDRADAAQRYRRGASQRQVIRMLVAVTLSFFLCCAPFYVQRLIAIYGKNLEHPTHSFYKVYEILTSLSGVLYFSSTSINPFLYNIMSKKFRDAFKATLSVWCTRRERYRLDRTYSAVLAERRQRAVAIASQRLHNPQMLHHFVTASSQQCDTPPQAQARTRLKKIHNGLLGQQREDAAARESIQCPHNPRMLRHFAAATCQQCVAPPRTKARSRLNKNHSALLERRSEKANSKASQRPHNPRMLQHMATTSSQQCVAPLRAQARSRLNKNHSVLLERRSEKANSKASQRPHNPRMLQHMATTSSQQCVAPPRAQPSFNRSNLAIVIEENESWLKRQRLAEGSDSMTSPQSISNSSLREINQELSGEELTNFLYEVNCNILGETKDSSV